MDEDKKANVVIKENVSRPGPRCYANYTYYLLEKYVYLVVNISMEKEHKL